MQNVYMYAKLWIWTVSLYSEVSADMHLILTYTAYEEGVVWLILMKNIQRMEGESIG